MTASSPADTIRRAAAKLRELAHAIEVEDHPDMPWHTEACDDLEGRGNCPCIVAQGKYSYHDEPQKPLFYVADAETAECAAYIAAMHPGVGLALADWLDAVADRVALLEATGATTTITPQDIGPHALAVARGVLGGEADR